MEAIINNEELVRYLRVVQREMDNDPRIKVSKVTDDRYYMWRMPHLLRKFRILKDNGKL